MDDEVALAVELALFAKEAGVLPYAGGLFDQDPYYLMLIRSGLRAFEKKREQDEKREVSKARSKR
jgi:hypothetical protein